MSNYEYDFLRQQISILISDFTIEVTPFAAKKIDTFDGVLRLGTKVFITSLSGVDYSETIALSKRLTKEGLCPVPHIAARNTPNKAFLDDLVCQLVDEAGIEEVLIIGGSVDSPIGDFSNSMQILETGIVDKYAIKRVGIAGHPEGSPVISDEEISKALIWKNGFADRSDADLYIVTQFCFEAEAIIAWERAIRAEGNQLPIRVGIPGIASIKTLMNYAKSCGVGQSINFLKRQGWNAAKLITTTAPDKQIIELALNKGEDAEFGISGVHMYPLGGFKKTTDWMNSLLLKHFKIHEKIDGFTVG